jgi:ABC-type transporter Mla maintaining outer membrane lipid asymmetry ATPase subunit MlaF
MISATNILAGRLPNNGEYPRISALPPVWPRTDIKPTTSLAPIVVQDMFRTLLEINRTTGTAIAVVEQNVAAALRTVERAIVLNTEGIIFDGQTADIERHEDLWRWFWTTYRDGHRRKCLHTGQ